MIDEPTVLVTGATDGLGRAVATDLARRGARVLVHGRDHDRIEATVAEIKRSTGSGRLDGYRADLSSLVEVRGLAKEVAHAETRLDVLVNNAGIGRGPTGAQRREESEDGYELRFAVNYLAPFLLTELMLPLLRQSAPSRIVHVASVGQAPIDFYDVMLEQSYDPGRAYSQSKLAMIMSAFTLAERLQADGSGVTVNALHPGTLMPTKIVHESWGYTVDTLEHGVDAVVRLAVDPDLEGVTGRYFDGREESRADGQAYDPEARENLRTLTQQLVDTA